MERSHLLSDSRCRISGVELCKSLDVFKGFVIYSERGRGEREEKNGRCRVGGPAGVKVNDAMLVSTRRWMAKNDWGWLVR
jgi:hypothetical protein